MQKNNLKYFLAANSCEGFISSFNKCYNAYDNWKAYIIKGGPGTGKSSFMKKIAEKANERNIKTELCPCSSDPNSLDAVIFPDKKIVILDGTSPHTLDPVYPGICESILNFGSFWKEEALKEKKQEILKLTNKNKALHQAASRYLRAAGQLLKDNIKTVSLYIDKTKALSFAKSLCKKHIPRGIGIGYEWERFLEGTTPDGIISFAEGIADYYNKSIIIEDAFGAVSDIILQRIREYALSNNHDIITIKNAFLPSMTDGVILPHLSLCFLREGSFNKFNSNLRRIHSRRFILTKDFNKTKRIKFNQKAITSLLSSAIDTLNKAKRVHDELESSYISAMNFEDLNAFSDIFIENLF